MSEHDEVILKTFQFFAHQLKIQNLEHSLLVSLTKLQICLMSMAHYSLSAQISLFSFSSSFYLELCQGLRHACTKYMRWHKRDLGLGSKNDKKIMKHTLFMI